MKMKNLLQLLVIASILIFGISLNANSQTSCYEEYTKVFNERGAAPVPDGTQEVVITVREQGGKADCYMGKVEVKDNKIVKAYGLILEDDSIKKFGVKLNEKYSDPTNPAILFMEILNGMSTAFLSDENKLLKIFFIKQLNAKAKPVKPSAPIKLAPAASSL